MADLNIVLVTSDYRGDHAADVSIAVTPPLETETVAELVARARLTSPLDRLEIRVVDETRDHPPTTTPDPWGPTGAPL